MDLLRAAELGEFFLLELTKSSGEMVNPLALSAEAAAGADAAWAFTVGKDVVWIFLRPIQANPSGRHTLLAHTRNAKWKVFRETKAEWFVLENVLEHLMESLTEEHILRDAQTQSSRLLQTIRNTIARLGRKGMPQGVVLTPAEDKEHICLQTSGLPEHIIERLLEVLREEAWGSKKVSKGLWGHLMDKD